MSGTQNGISESMITSLGNFPVMQHALNSFETGCFNVGLAGLEFTV